MGTTSYMRNNPCGEWNYTIQDWATPALRGLEALDGLGRQEDSFVQTITSAGGNTTPTVLDCWVILSHLLHPYMLATGSPEFPARVVSLGNKVSLPTRTPAPTSVMWTKMSRPSLNSQVVSTVVSSSTVNEYTWTETIRGHHGTLLMGGLGSVKIELRPERRFADEIDPEVFDELLPGEAISHHEKNWIECIRTQTAQLVVLI